MTDHGRRVYESILEMLPDEHNPTPLVALHRVLPYEHTKVYAKLEWYNPFGAVKDRIAANMIRAAADRGTLDEVTSLVEATSGNTGMGLVMVANASGYSVTTPLSKQIPLEKRIALRLFGSDVIELDDSLCPAPGQPEGAIQQAAQLGAEPARHNLNQYANEDNPAAHYRTTGPEIWRQTRGAVTHFVAGLGTCGTITGTGRYLKEQGPVQVLGVHPEEGHDIPGVRSIRQLAMTELFAPDEYDGLIEVSNQDAYAMTLRLNREESIVAGPSSGLALSGALRLVPDDPGTVVVVMFPDNVFKYTASFRRHYPDLFPDDDPAAAPTGPDPLVTLLRETARGSADTITPREAAEVGAADHVLIDVRTPPEFGAGRAPTSVNVPLADLENGNGSVRMLPEDKDQLIHAICGVGERSLTAMLILKSMGYRNVKNVDGGLAAWVRAGLPTEN
ncbi:MAG: pyridoxal-phosphate dependent enzyme [Acidimicrobiia bacterium]